MDDHGTGSIGIGRRAPGARPPLKTLLAGVAAGGAGALLVPGAAAAATMTVNSDSGAAADGTCGPAPGSCSLADAIQRANSGASPGADQIVFASAVTGDIDLTADLPAVTEDLTFSGPGSGTLAIDGQNGRRILEVTGAVEIGIDGLTLKAGLSHRRGAAIDAITGSVAASASSFSYNYVDGDTYAGAPAAGGAIYAPTMTISDSSFVGNTASGTGGGGRDAYGGALSAPVGATAQITIDSSTFDRNTASGSAGSIGAGGAIAVSGGELEITNSTLTGNRALGNGRGGGLNLARSTTGVVRSSTVAGNYADTVGGGIAVFSSNLGLSNSVVADNTAPGGGRDIFGSASASYSLIEDPSAATITGTTNITGQDPGLGPLTNNGGPTETMAITAASPAFNAGGGITSAADQRGILRPQGGGFDIGAFEIDIAPTVTIDAAPSGTTADSTPEIRFSSAEPDVAGFQCRIDGGTYVSCVSPYTTPALADGAHTVEVRATDTAGMTGAAAAATFTVDAPEPPPDPDPDPGPGPDPDPTPDPDQSVLDPDATAKKKQAQKGKTIKVKIKAGAGEPVQLVGSGRVKVKRKGKGKGAGAEAAAKKFKLKKVRKSTETGEQTVLRLKPKKRRDSRRIFRMLRRGKDLRANPSVKFIDEAGNTAVEKRVVRLKLKKR